MYNSVLKVFYILSTAWAIWLINKITESPYDPEQDSFQHRKYILLPVFFLTVMIGGEKLIQRSGYYMLEFLWTFSIILESFAMLPQLVLVWRHRRVERLAGFYIFAMGLYRIFYIFNWVYRAHTEIHYRHHWLVYVCGVVQSILYVDFFHYAITKRERPLISWRRDIANATCITEPLLSQDESHRDDVEEGNHQQIALISHQNRNYQNEQ